MRLLIWINNLNNIKSEFTSDKSMMQNSIAQTFYIKRNS